MMKKILIVRAPFREVFMPEIRQFFSHHIKLPIHEGLSFRAFESLFYEKKLITDNTSIKDYDFYHPNNILIVDYNDITREEIVDFINKKYYKLSNEIKNYYSLKSWFNRIISDNIKKNSK